MGILEKYRRIQDLKLRHFPTTMAPRPLYSCSSTCTCVHASPDVFMLEERGEPREESLRCCSTDASMLGGRERETLGPAGTIRVGLDSKGFWSGRDMALILAPGCSVAVLNDSLGLFIDSIAESVGLLGIKWLACWLTLLYSPPPSWPSKYLVSMVGPLWRGFPISCWAPNWFLKA